MRACLSNSEACTGILPCEECITALNTFAFAPGLVSGDAAAKEVVDKYFAKSEGPLDWTTVQRAHAQAFFAEYAKGLSELEKRIRDAIKPQGETAPISTVATVTEPSSPVATSKTAEGAAKDSSTSETPSGDVVQSRYVKDVPGERRKEPEPKDSPSRSSTSSKTMIDSVGVENGKG